MSPQTRKRVVEVVARGGIEPPTRGFSVLLPITPNRIKPSIN
jgi:hypothetical protein